ncbi:hypothetical protein FA249_30245, partial [Pseudomonas aeruginosa]|nr:hypothetical protein [Pseudomonas aeruginosa]
RRFHGAAADNAGGVIRPTGAGNEYPGSHPPRRANNRNAVIRRFHGAAADNAGGVIRPTGAGNEYPGAAPTS